MNARSFVTSFAATLLAVILFASARATARCIGVATMGGGSTWMIVCLGECNAFGIGCHEVVQDYGGGVGAVSCACKTSEVPSACCHTVVVYPPDELPYPDWDGSCVAVCGTGGLCSLQPAGGGEIAAVCPE